MADAQILIPKAQLPDCQVGEILEITGEDAENFIVETRYEEPAPTEGEEETPAAVKAVIG